MTDVKIPMGNDPVEGAAPAIELVNPMYARADTLRTYDNPKRYYAEWARTFDAACSNGGFGSSIYENGQTLTYNNCTNGTRIVKITPRDF